MRKQTGDRLLQKLSSVLRLAIARRRPIAFIILGELGLHLTLVLVLVLVLD